MKKIEIDLEVWKMIQSNLIAFDESENDVLRRLLKIDKSTDSSAIKDDVKGYMDNNVLFPNGTVLKSFYNGKEYECKINNGKLYADGELCSSFSKAAMKFANSSTNGWMFWKYYDENSKKWIPISNLR